MSESPTAVDISNTSQTAVSPDFKPSSWKKIILIVDDEVGVCRFLALRLEALGFHCEIAMNGVEGLEKARRILPDLILLDLKLPKMPGEAVCTAIKDSLDESLAKIPVIMITGKTSDTDRLVSKAIGASVFITKPFEIDEVLEHINRLLGI